MKNVKVILVALVLIIGTLTSYAAVEPVAKVKPTTEEIGKLLKNPGFVVDADIKAFVTFVVNKNNEIVVLSVDCDTKTICRFIKSRLNYNKLTTGLEKGKEYKVPVRIVSEV